MFHLLGLSRIQDSFSQWRLLGGLERSLSTAVLCEVLCMLYGFVRIGPSVMLASESRITGATPL